MTKKIKLTQGKFALVDDADFDWLNQWKWYAQKQRNTFYAVRNVRVGLKQKIVKMHRLILGLDFDDGRQGDHINMDTLDNRRANLRIAIHAQNQRNRGRNANNTSGYKGVYWNKQKKKWRAYIKVNGKQKYLGYFDDPIKAARAYDEAAKKHHKEFAQMNQMELNRGQ